MTELSIPLVSPDDDLLSAALKYAKAGWYVGPGSPKDRKNPGRLLGEKWPEKTSRDPETIVNWFAGTDCLLFLHVGRSGAWVGDVDDPEKLPEILADAIDRQRPPHQSSRPEHAGRGHYAFRQPPGRTIGNGTGALGASWGEGRGTNGVIFVCPSSHKNEADGARYEWLQTGVVPEMTPELAAALPDAANTSDPATEAEVAEFIAEHTSTATPKAAKGPQSAFAKRLQHRIRTEIVNNNKALASAVGRQKR